jgi:hypothetical protein
MDESLWLYHGAWSRIVIYREQSESNWRDVATALEAVFTGFAAIARSLIDRKILLAHQQYMGSSG